MLEEKGLPANGEEPALQPINIVGCGDMSFLQKIVGSGGACKVMKFFCLYCSCHGDQDMFYECFGEDRCVICKHNGSEVCTHMQINDDAELKRKANELLQILLDDFKESSGNGEATIRDMMTDELVHCFSGKFVEVIALSKVSHKA